MASSLPPVKGAAFTFPVSLVSQADTDVYKTAVTITTADVWVSKDGGAFVAATAAPTELETGAAAKTGVLWQGLTATEMTADIVTVLYHDAAGDEWQDALVTIYTAAQTFDTTDGIADDVKATVNHVTYGNSALGVLIGDVPTAAENADAVLDEAKGSHTGLLAKALPDYAAGAENGLPLLDANKQIEVNLFKIKGQDVAAASAVTFPPSIGTSTYAGADTAGTTTILGILSGITSLPKWLRGLFRKDAMDATAKSEVNLGGGTFDEATDSLEAQADDVPTGASSKVYTVTVGGVAAAGAYCRLCTDAACTVSVSAGTTNSLGQVTFWHNLPVGTAVWVHVVLDGYEALIDPETV